MIRVRDFKQVISGAFLIGFFLLLLFCVSGESELSKRIVVFSIEGSKPILAAIMLLLAFCLTCVHGMKVRTDSSLFDTLLFCTGKFSVTDWFDCGCCLLLYGVFSWKGRYMYR